MGGYKKLFEILLEHSFFKNNKCNTLSIIPTGITKEFFHKSDLICNVTPSSLAISYNASFTNALIAFGEDEIQMTFKLVAVDSFFYNYTKISKNFTKIPVWKLNQTNIEENKEKSTIIDFASESEEKDISDSFFKDVLTKTERINTPVGIICIPLGDFIKDNKIADTQKYIIDFKAKETFWRYNIITQNGNSFDKIKIRDSKSDVKFSNEIKVQLSNGTPANQITSLTPIVLKQNTDMHFELVGEKDSREVILMNRLEVPDNKVIKNEENREISELFIYC